MKQTSPDSIFFESLYQIDYDLFLQLKAKGCPLCHAPLDTANYNRKPRGLDEKHTLRLSLCCRREGCRKRVLPASLRFFGQKVYSLWVLVLAIDFREQLGLSKEISRQTLTRWRLFWQERLAETSPFMKWARSFLPPGYCVTKTPKNIARVFQFPARDSLIPMLKFFTQRL